MYIHVITLRFYKRDGKGRLYNTPYIDNSYKWAGGGFLSTTHKIWKRFVVVFQSTPEKRTERMGSFFSIYLVLVYINFNFIVE